MPVICPAVPKNFDPATWDDITLWAYTVLLEAESEPDEGKVAVAWVIRNRMDSARLGARSIILSPKQFSCWNPDYAAQRKARLTAPDPVVVDRCWRAASGAAWRLLPDPTNGAAHYLNEALTREQRGGSLPGWVAGATATLRIARHTFFKFT